MSSGSTTESLSALAGAHWDCVVIGAGVAGSTFAIQAAGHGKRVLLVESQKFPRDKVCGGCLNPRAQRLLAELGVLEDLQRAGAIQLDRFCLHNRGHVSDWPIPTMLSVRRSTLDDILSRRAVQAGATFRDGIRGRVLPSANADDREVELSEGDSPLAARVKVRSAMVVVAAGLSRSPLSRQESWPASTESDSRIGAAALLRTDLQSHPSRLIETLRDSGQLDGYLHMYVGQAGYVGICQTDGGCIDLASALDPKQVRRIGGIQRCVESILAESSFRDPFGDSPDLRFEATSLLTRRSSIVADQRVFLAGDSLGYVEPFTGEGMSWAMAGAQQLAELYCEPTVDKSLASVGLEWTRWVKRHRASKQSIAYWVAKRARVQSAIPFLLRLLDLVPIVRNYLVRKTMQ